MRVQLEGHAAFRAAERLTLDGEIELDALRVSLAACAGAEDHATLMALDTSIHRFVHHAAANPYLEETLSGYLNLSLRIWYLVLDRLPHLGARVHEHTELLMAIRERDPERSRAIMAAHIATFEREIRAVL